MTRPDPARPTAIEIVIEAALEPAAPDSALVALDVRAHLHTHQHMQTTTDMIRLALTQNQEGVLQFDDLAVARSYGLTVTEDREAFEGTAAAWRGVAEAAEFFAKDWAEAQWNDPKAASARSLARKIRTHLARTGAGR
jgi:hypothetical protein